MNDYINQPPIPTIGFPAFFVGLVTLSLITIVNGAEINESLVTYHRHHF